MAFDFCKVKRGRDDGLLRTMHTDKVGFICIVSASRKTVKTGCRRFTKERNIKGDCWMAEKKSARLAEDRQFGFTTLVKIYVTLVRDQNRNP